MMGKMMYPALTAAIVKPASAPTAQKNIGSSPSRVPATRIARRTQRTPAAVPSTLSAPNAASRMRSSGAIVPIRNIRKSRMNSPSAPPGVLLVEDQEEVLELLAMVFAAEGFTVHRSADGRQALDLFTRRKDEIAVIVTDLGLPVLDGVELIRGARALSSAVKIIGASGYGQLEVRDKVVAAGADMFVPKPFNAQDLVAAARTLLGLS